MSNRIGGAQRGTAYLGTKADKPPNMYVEKRNPTVTDINYEIGDIWLNSLTLEKWILVSLKNPGSPVTIKGVYATWDPWGNASTIDSLSGNANPGVFVSPDASNNIQLASAIAGLTITGDAVNHRIIFSSTLGSIVTKIQGDAGPAVSPDGSGIVHIESNDPLLSITSIGAPANTLYLKYTGSGPLGSWLRVNSVDTITVVKGFGYISYNPGTQAFILPATASVGDTFAITDDGLGTGWTLAQNAGQLIVFGNEITITGVGGSLSSTDAHDIVELICIYDAPGAEVFEVIYSVGNIQMVTAAGIVTNNSWNSENPAEVAKGGTGRNSLTANSVIVGGTASTTPVQSVDVSSANAGYVLTYTGAAGSPNVPVWSPGATSSNPCCFLSTLSTTVNNVTGDGTIYSPIFDLELYDVGNNYNNVSGVFTAPITGKYHFDVHLWMTNIVYSNVYDYEVWLTTTKRNYIIYAKNYDTSIAPAGPYYSISVEGGTDADLDAGETAYIRCFSTLNGGGGSKQIGLAGRDSNGERCYFSGHLLNNTAQPAALCSFSSYASINQPNITGFGAPPAAAPSPIVNFGSVRYNIGNGYDGVNTFVAPYTGKYVFNTCVHVEPIVPSSPPFGDILLNIIVNGPAGTVYECMHVGSNAVEPFYNALNALGNVQIALNAGDTVNVNIRVSGNPSNNVGVIGSSTHTYFMGYLFSL